MGIRHQCPSSIHLYHSDSIHLRDDLSTSHYQSFGGAYPWIPLSGTASSWHGTFVSGHFYIVVDNALDL